MTSETFLNALQQFNDKDFLIASLAASALVTMADGVISAKEKQKMVLFIDGYRVDARNGISTTLRNF